MSAGPTARPTPRPPRRSGWRRLPPVERRAQIVAALRRVVERVGFHGASVPAVVAEAGLAQGTFYRSFANLDEALLELVRGPLRAIAEALGALRVEVRRVGDRPQLEEALVRFYEVLARELADQAPILREALLVAPSSQGAIGAEMSRFLDAMRAGVRAAVKQASRRRPFRRLDPNVTTAAIVGMVLGAAQEAAFQGPSLQRESWAREMARFEAGAVLDLETRHPSRSPKRRPR